MELEINRTPPPLDAAPAFDAAVRAAVGVKYKGFAGRKGKLFLVMEEATADEENAARTAAMNHDYAARTATQQEQATGKADSAALLAAIDTALADIASKRTAFNAAPTLLTAAPLLNELAQDMTGVLKALKYVIKHKLG